MTADVARGAGLVETRIPSPPTDARRRSCQALFPPAIIVTQPVTGCAGTKP